MAPQPETLQQRLIPWVRAETLNGRGVPLDEVVHRYQISLAEARQLADDIKDIAQVGGLVCWSPQPQPARRARARSRHPLSPRRPARRPGSHRRPRGLEIGELAVEERYHDGLA